MFTPINISTIYQDALANYNTYALNAKPIAVACIIGMGVIGLIVYVLMTKVKDSRPVHISLGICGLVFALLVVMFAMQTHRIRVAENAVDQPTVAEIASENWDINLLGAVGTTDNGSIDIANDDVTTLVDLGPSVYEARWFKGDGDTPHFGKLTLTDSHQLELVEYNTDTY